MTLSTANITDSSDWAGTKIPELSQLDEALRCDICKEFMTAPMLTSCFHSFCSLCIRRVLVKEGRCPTCRTRCSEAQLRKNTTVEVCVNIFERLRGNLIKIVSKNEESETPVLEPSSESSQSPAQATDHSQNDNIRRTRSSTRKTSGQSNPETIPPGHAKCPVCDKVLKITDIEGKHLPLCLARSQPSLGNSSGESSEYEETSSRKSSTKILELGKSRSSKEAEQLKQRIPRSNELRISLPKLRTRLAKYGIPTNGNTKQELLDRETEWINLWNANADSSHPHSKKELLEELDRWEKAQKSTRESAKSSRANMFMAASADTQKIASTASNESSNQDNTLGESSENTNNQEPNVNESKGIKRSLEEDSPNTEENQKEEDKKKKKKLKKNKKAKKTKIDIDTIKPITDLKKVDRGVYSYVYNSAFKELEMEAKERLAKAKATQLEEAKKAQAVTENVKAEKTEDVQE